MVFKRIRKRLAYMAKHDYLSMGFLPRVRLQPLPLSNQKETPSNPPLTPICSLNIIDL
jgi:hypothetical protein